MPRTLILALLLGLSAPTLSAQIVEMRDYHGEEIYCSRSGLHGWAESCGADNEFYVYVFTGTVLSIVDVADSEQRLKIGPEEVFYGKPPATLTVFTNQARCLPELRIGDKWLFSIYKSHQNRLIVSYGHNNAPVAESAAELALLRRLAQMHDTGLVRGRVMREQWDDEDKSVTSVPVAGHKITATRTPHQLPYQKKAQNEAQTVVQSESQTEYTAVTDAEGNYEFAPLPLGTYEVRGHTDGTAWSEGGELEIKPGSCYYVGYEMRSGGTISGRVVLPGEDRDAPLWVKAIDAKDPKDPEADSENAPGTAQEVVSASIYVEHRGGHYELKALRPGRYLIAAELYNQADPHKPLRIYYPGVTSADRAIVIEVQKTESHPSIDFEIPRP